MQRKHCKKLIAALVFAVGAFAWIAFGASAPLRANPLQIEVESAWARPAIAQGNGSAYFVMRNTGDQPATLVGASSSVARYTEIHETYVIHPDAPHADDHAHHDHGHEHHDHDHEALGSASMMLGMRKIEALELAPGQEIAFEPGGYHIMLIELLEPLAWGDTFEVVLHFEGGHSVSVPVSVGSEPAR